MSFLETFWKLIPADYKWSVGIKKAGIMAGKAIAGLLVGSQVGAKLSPQHVEAVGTVITVLTTAGLEWLHDWAKMKYPDAKWL